jgi:hypothetical protein
MELVYEFTYTADLAPALRIGDGPQGTRVIRSALGGTVTGERINGRFEGAGGDWMLVGPDGFARLDGRGQIRTDDDAVLYLSFVGLVELNEQVRSAAAAGASTAYDDQYFRTTPRLETGDSRYSWVNTTLFTGTGRLTSDGVEFDVYRLT